MATAPTVYDKGWNETFGMFPKGGTDARQTIIYPLLLKRLKTMPHAHILDVGGANGATVYNLRQKGLRFKLATVMDINANLLAAGRKQVDNPRIQFMQADALKPWTIADTSQDVVLAIHIFNDVRSITNICQETARVLKPGGSLFVVTLHPMVPIIWQSVESWRGVPEDQQKVVGDLHPHARHEIGYKLSGTGTRVRYYQWWTDDIINTPIQAGMEFQGLNELGIERGPGPDYFGEQVGMPKFCYFEFRKPKKPYVG